MSTHQTSFFEHLRGRLIVSCQAREGNPLRGPEAMALMARAAEFGGAAAIRVNGPTDTRAVMQATSLPCLALYKVDYEDSDVRITPTLRDTRELLTTGAPMIALDATNRRRPGGESLVDSVAAIHAAGALAFGDCARPDDLEGALAAGCDAVGTTLAGYTAETASDLPEPDFATLAWFTAHSPVPVYAEGRFWHPEQIARAFDLGAHCVCVGTAITNPMEITRYMISQSQKLRAQ
ncbi:MAG: N-acetylmannosamine-6-phosphate 2-epimerase [Thermomicrobiales bacterium]|nr:N-acetylmannosamine-6-phosphate 2-epimerase [Thermomicrobiales bacterium]MCO5224244.1 N-acetylmannosamine-6-phosphate 2-epimerase [Thermomicrobiales bacterium]